MVRILAFLINWWRGSRLGARGQWPFDVLKRLGYNNRRLIYARSRMVIGRDMAPTENEYGCVEAVYHVVLGATGLKLPDNLSTYRLMRQMVDAPWMRRIDRRHVKPGDLILSPTGFGNGNVSNGHIGIMGRNGKIYSNNSRTYKWDDHLNLRVWEDYYAERGGFPVYFIRIKG